MMKKNEGIYILLDCLKKGEIDFSSLNFATPILLLGVLSAYRQEKLRIEGVDEAYTSKPNIYNYIVHCGFLYYYRLDNISPNLDYPNLIPISHINKKIDPTIADQLSNKIISNDSVIKYSFSFIFRELLDNTIRHSKANFDNLACYYMLQKYPANNTVHICIVDNGVGIKKSLESKFNLDTDLDYILKAFEKGVTSRGNAGGNGLFFTKEIVKKTDSKLYYWSGDYVYIIKNGKEFNLDTKKHYGIGWKGILLDMELNLNKINSDTMKEIGIDIEDELDNMEYDIFI